MLAMMGMAGRHGHAVAGSRHGPDTTGPGAGAGGLDGMPPPVPRSRSGGRHWLARQGLPPPGAPMDAAGSPGAPGPEGAPGGARCRRRRSR